MVFQDALTALNPVFTVGWQLGELFRRAPRLLARAGQGRGRSGCSTWSASPPRKRRVDDYPHQFSGGMRQRVMIAMALALDPDVLIADEPTTALDVTVQAQIMKLLADLQAERNMGLILITHDMGVVADVADDICVMYAGRVVERADVSATSTRARPTPTPRRCSSRSPARHEGPGSWPSIKGLPPSLTRPADRLRLPPALRLRPGPVPRRRTPPLYEVDGTRQLSALPLLRGGARIMSPMTSEVVLAADQRPSSTSRSRRASSSRAPSGRSRPSTACRLELRKGETLGDRGRVRLRQVDPGAAAHGPRAGRPRARSSSHGEELVGMSPKRLRARSAATSRSSSRTPTPR